MVKVALAQINLTIGDLAGNADRIVEAARRAHGQGARVVLTPELGLCGYSPEDMLLRPSFMLACAARLQEIADRLADCEGLHVVVGHPHQFGDRADLRTRSRSVQLRYNAASVLAGGKVLGTYCKRELPNYQVFDERRYFRSGRDIRQPALVFEVDGLRFGVVICEDAWFDEPPHAAKVAGAQVLCVLNASPFHLGKVAEREARMVEQVRNLGLPLLFTHMVGGQDEVVFDGGSFALDARARIAARSPMFEEALDLVEVSAEGTVVGRLKPAGSEDAQVWGALVTGVRDYVEKNGFAGVVLGLSGGIDSALVLAIAADALGADRVRTVMMPSAYTAEISREDAREMARRLGVQHDEIAIAHLFEDFRRSLATEFAGLPEDATEENLQARIRATLLMAISNKTGYLLLSTGNKSELATGHCTLYGDMAGGFAAIKDLSKTWVYRLAKWKNAQGPEVIPQRVMARPPSAELRPGQTDQDTLPDYVVIDAIVERYIEEDQSVDQIVASGLPRADVERVRQLIKANEYKRRQAPVGTRITHRAFGRDWRYPITSKFRV